jgi:hypothetical protein
MIIKGNVIKMMNICRSSLVEALKRQTGGSQTKTEATQQRE